MVGRTLSHYRIIEKLGEGAMGVVYKAHDGRLDRSVAIKVLPAGKVADAGCKQRFVREARAASALNHPNIVTIHEIHSEDDVDFIVMEHVDGTTVDKTIGPKGLRPAEVVRYAVQIADALTKAHAAGIIHRDLKPSNIMVTREGRVKVLDFGLAKLTERPEPSPDSTTLTAGTLTEEGTALGTASYMSPEQAEGRKVDARSDIFSFGTVLYEMTTGRRPFRGDSTMAILAKILNEEPTPPAQLTSSVPHDFEKIILRCLRKDPARRYQTMADLKVALEDVQAESGTAPRARPVRSLWKWVTAGLVSLLLIAAFAGWHTLRPPADTQPLRAVPLITQPGMQRYPSISPDGNHVAFTWIGPKRDNPDIYVQQIGAGEPLRLTTDPGNDYNPVWSPDGRSIAFLRRQSDSEVSEVRLIPPLKGTELKLAEIRVRDSFAVIPPYLCWCPDGSCLVVTDSPGEGKLDALFVISKDPGGGKRQLTSPQPPSGGDTNPAVSPDGKWLVFRRPTGGMYTGVLYALRLGKDMTGIGEPQRITAVELDPSFPTWMPNSREILFSARASLWRLPVPKGTTPSRIPFVGEDGVTPVVSRAQAGRPARLVYVRSFADDNLWRVYTSSPGIPASTPPKIAVESTRRDAMPQLSPDGRRVAFTSDRSGEWEIWVSDIDRTNPLRLTFLKAIASGYPHWSPDGERIVFHSNVEGQWEVFSISSRGGKPQNLTANPTRDYFPSFSRDGRWIYFNSARTGEPRIWKMPASGGDALPVLDRTGEAPQESPDGSWLYFVESIAGSSPLWRMPSAGGIAEKLVEDVDLANFAVLDRGIYYVDRIAGGAGIHFLDRSAGETRLRYFDLATRRSRTIVPNLGNISGVPITASADGRIIVYPRQDSPVDDLMLVENFR